MLTSLWIIQLSPLIAFLVLSLLRRFTHTKAELWAVASHAAAFLANMHLWFLYGTGRRSLVFSTVWIKTSAMDFGPLFGLAPQTRGDLTVGFLIDPLNLLLLTLVTTISLLVQIFSVFYMSEDRDRPRYFAFMSLFSFSMIGLVLSHNLLQTFMFWELVGISSYLLIGFWFEKESASQAARKAFLMTRLADLGFFLGIIILFLTLGTLELSALRPETLTLTLSGPLITLIGMLIFSGVMGKSAQVPFHLWLPDAMEGPTPVSALIHSATMVAAGVFLLARVFDIFAASELTLRIVLIFGTLTAFLAATLAAVQRDIKRILAYSTISQLGLMTMAMGAGAFAAGIFHLTTHAFFKSLLFLTAGVWIHRYKTNDILEIGMHGARREAGVFLVLIVGLASLSGLFPFSGFFSKDIILHELMSHRFPFYIVGLLIAFLTAFYSSRLLAVIIFSRIEKAHAPHKENITLRLSMAVPLALLALFSIGTGFLGTPLLSNVLPRWIDPQAHKLTFETGPFLVSLGVILAGVLIALLLYRRPEKALALEEAPGFQRILLKKYYLDDILRFLVEAVVLRLAAFFRAFDLAVVNGLMVNETAFSTKRVGRFFIRMQNGIFQDYLFIAAMASMGVLVYFLKSGGT